MTDPRSRHSRPRIRHLHPAPAARAWTTATYQLDHRQHVTTPSGNPISGGDAEPQLHVRGQRRPVPAERPGRHDSLDVPRRQRHRRVHHRAPARRVHQPASLDARPATKAPAQPRAGPGHRGRRADLAGGADPRRRRRRRLPGRSPSTRSPASSATCSPAARLRRQHAGRSAYSYFAGATEHQGARARPGHRPTPCRRSTSRCGCSPTSRRRSATSI